MLGRKPDKEVPVIGGSDSRHKVLVGSLNTKQGSPDRLEIPIGRPNVK